MCIRLANGINSFNGRFSKSLPNGRGSFVFDYDLATIEGPFNSGSLHGKTKMTNKQGNLQFSGRKREEGKLMDLKRNRFFPFCPYRNSINVVAANADQPILLNPTSRVHEKKKTSHCLL